MSAMISVLEIREMVLTDPRLFLDCGMLELRKEGGAKPQHSSDRYPAEAADKKGHCDLCAEYSHLY